VLVACYSRSGNTRRTAEAAAEALRELGAEVTLEEIVDRKPRGGLGGWLGAVKDAFFGSPTVIGGGSAAPEAYDVLVVGTPVWAGTATPAALAYCRVARGRARRTAFFCTMLGIGSRQAFSAMNQAVGDEPLATMALTGKQSAAPEHLRTAAAEFAGAILDRAR
jgi:flavodoxin